MRLANKVIIITGSCTGIGKAIARRCVAEGARVVVHGLDQQAEGEALIAELGPDKAVLHLEDITADGAPQRLVSRALDAFGKLDGIVNNAAMIATSNIHTTSLAFFRTVLEVKYPCAVCPDSGSIAPPDPKPRGCAQHWFGQRLVR